MDGKKILADAVMELVASVYVFASHHDNGEDRNTYRQRLEVLVDTATKAKRVAEKYGNLGLGRPTITLQWSEFVSRDHWGDQDQ